MRVLILKKNNTDFEIEFSNAMKTEEVDVYEPFKKVCKISRYTRALHKRSKINLGFSIWLNDWKRNIKKYDYIIHFDNDVSLETIKWISIHNKGCKQLLWLWNIPNFNINEYKEYCKIACFDTAFSKANNIYYLKQFFCEKILCELQSVKDDNKMGGIVYIGYDKNRYHILYGIAASLEEMNLSYNFILKRSNNSPLKSNKRIRFINDDIEYKKVLAIEKNADAILELNREGQKGITLRALEAMFFEKKLITNNKNIVDCDFYDPLNIFIIGVDKDLRRFMREPYRPIDKKITNEYKYISWLDNIIHLLDS